MQEKASERQGGSQQSGKPESGSLFVAKCFKYFSQFNNPHIRFPVDFGSVAYQSFHCSHRKTFGKLSAIFRKYHIHPVDFIKFALSTKKVYTPELIMTPYLFLEYATMKDRRAQYAKIWKNYQKSVANMAKMCIDGGISPKEAIRNLITENRLAYEYVSGRLSKYYLASFSNFKELYWHLDQMNKTELRIIFNAAQELNSVLQDAAIIATGRRTRPIRDVEDKIKELKNRQKQTTQEKN